VHAARLADDDRPAAVGGLADRGVERDLAEEVAAHLLRRRARAAMVEDIGALAAMGAAEIAHILDDPEDRHVDLAEHVETLAGVEQGDVLRRRDDDRAGQRRLLHQGELRIAGARRQIDDENVERRPGDVAEQLAERAHHHRAAPDDGVLGRHEKAHRHALHAVILQRLDALLRVHLRLPVDAHHARHRGPVDIRVEDADRLAEAGQRQRQIDRRRRLADAALARGDGDDRADARQRAAGFGFGRRGRPFGRDRLGQHGGRRQHPGDSGGGLFAGGAHRLHLCRRVGRGVDRQMHHAVLHHEAGEQAEADHIAAAARHRNVPQGLEDLFFRNGRHLSTRAFKGQATVMT